MTTAIDVLNYIRTHYSTMGRMQRQKLLFYAQSWHLAWNGQPLFPDRVEAWDMGPVVREAWKADPQGETHPTTTADPVGLDATGKATVDAVVDFYGRMSGTELSALTHAQYPWSNAHANQSVFNMGRSEIKPATMRGFCALEAVKGNPRPQKPTLPSRILTASEVAEVSGQELPRWQGVLELLAER